MKGFKSCVYYFLVTLLLVSNLMLFKAACRAAVHVPEYCFGYCILAIVFFFSGQDIITFFEDKRCHVKHNKNGKSIAFAALTRILFFVVAYLCATQAEYATSTFLYSLLSAVGYFCIIFGRIIAYDIREQRICKFV